jgi:PII-like signaling protein
VTDALKLTTYFGERDRAGDRYLADALADLYARHGLRTSVLLRGVEGFGPKQLLRTDRLLTLSEDLPMVSTAVDERPAIEGVLGEVRALAFDGLVTLERARLITAESDGDAVPGDAGDAIKLTVYLGRYERIGGRLGHQVVVDVLRARGVAGATALLGVDGTAHGERRRARFFGANTTVPLMVVAVGARERVADAAGELRRLLPRPLMTVERVRVCKRDGQLLAEPHQTPDTDPSAPDVATKLMIYASEQSRSEAGPLHGRLIRALREAGAAGATTLRGIWGFHGDHRPHGDVLWQIRRHVPVVIVVVDTPARSRRWFEIVDHHTRETGLVTSELVPSSIARLKD